MWLPLRKEGKFYSGTIRHVSSEIAASKKHLLFTCADVDFDDGTRHQRLCLETSVWCLEKVGPHSNSDDARVEKEKAFREEETDVTDIDESDESELEHARCSRSGQKRLRKRRCVLDSDCGSGNESNNDCNDDADFVEAESEAESGTDSLCSEFEKESASVERSDEMLTRSDVMTAWLGPVHGSDVERYPFANAVGGRAFTLISSRWGPLIQTSEWMRSYLMLLCRGTDEIQVDGEEPRRCCTCIVCGRKRSCLFVKMANLYGQESVPVGTTCLKRCRAARELYRAWDAIKDVVLDTENGLSRARDVAERMASRFNRALAELDASLGMDSWYGNVNGRWGYRPVR